MKGKRVLAALTVRLDSGRVLEPSTKAEEEFAPHPLTTIINNEVRLEPRLSGTSSPNCPHPYPRKGSWQGAYLGYLNVLNLLQRV